MPHLEPLKPVFNFTIESQILYHAPLSFEPQQGIAPDTDLNREGNGAWLIGEEDAKIFVNSERWSLGKRRALIMFRHL